MLGRSSSSAHSPLGDTRLPLTLFLHAYVCNLLPRLAVSLNVLAELGSTAPSSPRSHLGPHPPHGRQLAELRAAAAGGGTLVYCAEAHAWPHHLMLNALLLRAGLPLAGAAFRARRWLGDCLDAVYAQSLPAGWRCRWSARAA